MAQKLIDFYKHILQYDDKTVYIAFDSKTMDPFFHGKQLCEMLEYTDYRDAIERHVNKEDIFYLKDIVKNYKTLYKNVRGSTKFLNEAGMYVLILRSKNKKAKEITDWITHEVMPSIRKYGIYKLEHPLKKEMDKLNKVIDDYENKMDEQQNKIDVLEHNLKNVKFPEGGSVYIMRIINDTMKFDENTELYLKFGRTSDMNLRKPTFDTTTNNKVQILKLINVDDPKNIEHCVLKKLKSYKIKDRKEYFKCSYNIMIEEIANCIKFFDNKDVDKKPDISNLNRQTDNVFDVNQKIIVKILTDEEFDKLFKNDNEKDKTETDTEIDEEDEDKEDYEIVDQKGGNKDIYYEYLITKSKYWQLEYELL